MPRFWKFNANMATAYLWLRGYRGRELRESALAIAVYDTGPWRKLTQHDIRGYRWEMSGGI